MPVEVKERIQGPAIYLALTLVAKVYRGYGIQSNMIDRMAEVVCETVGKDLFVFAMVNEDSFDSSGFFLKSGFELLQKETNSGKDHFRFGRSEDYSQTTAWFGKTFKFRGGAEAFAQDFDFILDYSEI